MIFVMLGTQNNSFHRLLEKIDELIKKGKIKDEVIVQAGYTKYQSENMKIFDLIPRDKIEEYQKKADFIITHGGVGSIISSLKLGKKSNSSTKNARISRTRKQSPNRNRRIISSKRIYHRNKKCRRIRRSNFKNINIQTRRI